MLIDTDVLIWATRGNEKAQQTLDAIEQPHLSIVTVIELMQGSRNADELRQIERGITAWAAVVISIDAPIGNVARDLIREYALSSGLQLADALIAASAIHHGLALISGNRKHFDKIAGLDFRVFAQ